MGAAAIRTPGTADQDTRQPGTDLNVHPWGRPEGMAMNLVERLFVGLAITGGVSLFGALAILWVLGL